MKDCGYMSMCEVEGLRSDSTYLVQGKYKGRNWSDVAVESPMGNKVVLKTRIPPSYQSKEVL